MKKILFLILLVSTIFASQKLEIEAKKFYSNEKKGFLEFKGNVKIQKGVDTLFTEKVVVKLDKKKKPIEYETFGGSSFSISMKNKVYKGSCEKIIYQPKLLKYTLRNGVEIREVNTNNKIEGDEIIIDKRVGEVKVNSKDEKPVKFTFDIEEK